VRSFWLK